MDFICLKYSVKALPPSPTNSICHKNKIVELFLEALLQKKRGKNQCLGLREYIATCVWHKRTLQTVLFGSDGTSGLNVTATPPTFKTAGLCGEGRASAQMNCNTVKLQLQT